MVGTSLYGGHNLPSDWTKFKLPKDERDESQPSPMFRRACSFECSIYWMKEERSITFLRQCSNQLMDKIWKHQEVSCFLFQILSQSEVKWDYYTWNVNHSNVIVALLSYHLVEVFVKPNYFKKKLCFFLCLVLSLQFLLHN